MVLEAKFGRIIVDNKIYGTELIKFAYPDEFIKHGNTADIEKKYGLDAYSIANAILGKKDLRKKITIKEIKNRGIKCLKMVETGIKVKKRDY